MATKSVYNIYYIRYLRIMMMLDGLPKKYNLFFITLNIMKKKVKLTNIKCLATWLAQIDLTDSALYPLFGFF